MNKSETKFHNTSKKMYNALFILLEEKSFDSITIKDLCACAKINRSTFYAHFFSMAELLNDAKKYIVDKFFVSFKENLIQDNNEHIPTEEYTLNNYIIPYLIFVKEHKLIFKVFVENLNTFNADEYFNYLLNIVFIPVLTKKGINDTLTIKYLSKYYLNGVKAIVMDWIKRECIDDISYIANVILLCNKYTIM